MAALREIFARFGVEFDRAGAVQRGDRATSGLTDRLRQLGAVVGGTMLVRGLVRMGTDVMRLADDLDKLSQQVGLTAREFQAYSHAAALAGVQQQQLTVALSAMLRNANAANRGATEMRAAFRRAGIESVATGGRLKSTSELLGELADGLMDVENEGERTALTMTLLGEEGRRLLPMLAQGSAGLAGMEAELDRLGGGASEEFIRRSVEINDNLTRWRVSLMSLKTQLMIGMMPAVNRAVGSLTRFASVLSRDEGAAGLLRATMIALGIAAVAAAGKSVAAWLAAGWPILLLVAILAVAVLAAQDFWVTLQGGDSQLRQFINTLWPGMVDGLDSTDRSIRFVVDSVAALIVVLGALGDIVAPLGDMLTAPFRPLIATLGLVQDMAGGMGIGRAASRFAGRMTADVAGVTGRGSLIGESPEEGRMRARRESAAASASQLTSGGLGRDYTALRASMMPARITATETSRRQPPPSVDARSDVTINIHDAGILTPREAADLAKREVREALDSQTRQITAALVPADEVIYGGAR